MRINEHVAITTSVIVLVPYSKHQVSKYHEWMKDEDIQTATASEPLSVEEEYSMQESWRRDNDKLTFITCLPFANVGGPDSIASESQHMVGDVNLFVVVNEEDDARLSLVGELELMIAEKSVQRQGLGRAALLAFLVYILKNQREIMEEYFNGQGETPRQSSVDYFRVKINSSNHRSIKLFESLGFSKQRSTPNIFDEFELRRRNDFDVKEVTEMMDERGIRGYSEVVYSAADKPPMDS